MEYVRIKSGATSAKMSNSEHRLFVDIVFADECPTGYLPVDKILPKPTPGDGEELCYTYTNLGDRITKEYFTAPKGSSFRPKKYSKLKLYSAIASLGAWQAVQSWLEAKTIDGVNGWLAFQLAQEISDDHPLFAPLAEEARRMLNLTQEQFDALLSQCILED